MKTIGSVAKQLELSAHTLRYYEKIGLISPIAKDQSGRRNYQAKDIQQIKFIKRAQRMNFSLEEIQQLIDLQKLPAVPKKEAQALVATKLASVEQSLHDLERLKKDLSSMLSQCLSSGDSEDCPIIEGMNNDQ